MTRQDGTALRGDELEAATEVLAAALHDDAGWAHVVADPRRRRFALRTILGSALRDAQPFGHVLVVRERGRPAGVAVWLPPGRFPLSARRKAESVPAMLGLSLRAPRDAPGLIRFGAALEAAFPTEPVWYLEALGVHPDHQRQGLGRRLLRPVLQEADRTGVACYLETAEDRNVTYYERSGFSVVGDPGPVHRGGPWMALMKRPAGSAGG